MASGRVVHVHDEIPGAVYVGGAQPWLRLPPSPFANPFRVGQDGGRHAVIAAYRRRLLSRPGLLSRLPTLRDRPLACWCRHDGQAEPACHADVLLELLDRFSDRELRSMPEETTP